MAIATTPLITMNSKATIRIGKPDDEDLRAAVPRVIPAVTLLVNGSMNGASVVATTSVEPATEAGRADVGVRTRDVRAEEGGVVVAVVADAARVRCPPAEAAVAVSLCGA